MRGELNRLMIFIAYNVPAVYDVLAARISKCAAFAGPAKCALWLPGVPYRYTPIVQAGVLRRPPGRQKRFCGSKTGAEGR
jgi:hypothetical protein